MEYIGLRKFIKEELARGFPGGGPVRGVGECNRRREPATTEWGTVLGVQPAGLPAPHAAELSAGAEEDAAVVERRLGARLNLKRLSQCQ